MRTVYRDVNSGFGASLWRKEIGIGQATVIDQIAIEWHPSQQTQVFRNIQPNQFLRIQEGNPKIEEVRLKILNFNKTTPHQHLLSATRKE